MADPVSIEVVAGLLLAFSVVMLVIYRYANKKIMARLSEIRKRNDDLGHVIERLYQARLNDNREVRTRIDKLEDKLDALRKPVGREREVALEKVFARRH